MEMKYIFKLAKENEYYMNGNYQLITIFQTINHIYFL